MSDKRAENKRNVSAWVDRELVEAIDAWLDDRPDKDRTFFLKSAIAAKLTEDGIEVSESIRQELSISRSPRSADLVAAITSLSTATSGFNEAVGLSARKIADVAKLILKCVDIIEERESCVDQALKLLNAKKTRSHRKPTAEIRTLAGVLVGLKDF